MRNSMFMGINYDPLKNNFRTTFTTKDKDRKSIFFNIKSKLFFDDDEINNKEVNKKHSSNKRDRKQILKAVKYEGMISEVDNKISKFLGNVIKKYIENQLPSIEQKFISIINNDFGKRMSIFETYEDQIQDLKMMMDGNSDSNTTIQLLIENLKRERNKEEIQIDTELDNNIDDYIKGSIYKNSLNDYGCVYTEINYVLCDICEIFENIRKEKEEDVVYDNKVVKTLNF